MHWRVNEWNFNWTKTSRFQYFKKDIISTSNRLPSFTKWATAIQFQSWHIKIHHLRWSCQATQGPLWTDFRWQHLYFGIIQRSWHSATSSHMSTSYYMCSRTAGAFFKYLTWRLHNNSKDSDSTTKWWATRTSRRMRHNTDKGWNTQWRAMAGVYGHLPSE